MSLDIQAEASYIARLLRGSWSLVKIGWDKFGPLRFEQLVNVKLQEVEARFNADDDAIFRCYLCLENFSRRRIELLDLHLHIMRVASVGFTDDLRPVLSSSGKEIEARQTERLKFTVPIRAKAIRRIGHNMNEAQNVYSSPRDSFEIRGFFRIRHGWGERKLLFDFGILPKYYVAPSAEISFKD